MPRRDIDSNGLSTDGRSAIWLGNGHTATTHGDAYIADGAHFDGYGDYVTLENIGGSNISNPGISFMCRLHTHEHTL